MSIVTTEVFETGSTQGDLIELRYLWTWTSGYFEEMYRYMASVAEGQTDAEARAPIREAAKTLQDQERVRELMVQSPDGTVLYELTPDFPDELPEFDSSFAVDTRRRRFHRYLIRWAWPQQALTVINYWLPIWVPFIEQMQAPNARTYLDTPDLGVWGDITARISNLRTIDGLLVNDVPGEIP